MADLELNHRVTQIVKPLIPSGAEEEVELAYRQFNQAIREHIRSETGMKLSDTDGRTSAIQVKIVDGFTDEFASLVDRYRDPVLWHLILGQPKLAKLMEGAAFLVESWDRLKGWPKLPPEAHDGRSSLEGALRTAESLQRIAKGEEVRKEITKLKSDWLGAYRYPPGRQPWIEIYWMPIAMAAGMLEVEIADLTLVTLAHELAHGYTHIGYDIDGAQWPTRAFAAADVAIKEGLAQFYTQVVASKMTLRAAGMRTAFDKLLAIQGAPYKAHQQWFTDKPEEQGEVVRFAMISARNSGVAKSEDWVQVLARAREGLRKAQNPDALFSDGGAKP
ncbi:MAG: hypothetical protein AB7G11_03750 [Phycisphaerales bacterium]